LRAPQPAAPGIVYCSHAFHGLTYGALSLNGDDNFRKGFEPLLRIACEFRSTISSRWSRRQLSPHRCVHCRADPGQGVILPNEEYLKGAEHLCRRYETLFVTDEIQTGMGRTGKFLAGEHWGIEPDMVLLAKALSGGHVPVGAVLMRKWVFDKVFSRMDRAVNSWLDVLEERPRDGGGHRDARSHEGRAGDRERGAHR